MRLISRNEALSLGLKRYFTGKPCKHGHIAERQTNNGTCLVCRPQILIKFHGLNPGLATRWSNEYRKEHPELAKKHADASYRRHKAKRLAQGKKYREQNKAKLYAQKKEYIAKNQLRVRSLKSNYRARKRLAEGTHSAFDIKKIFSAQRGKCACCRASLRKIGYHVDHIIPLIRGGTNWPSNLQLLCATCNIKKGPKDPIDFMRHEAGRLL